MPFNFGYVLGLWLLFRCIGALMILYMLHRFLQTATRRRERAYLRHVSLPERYFGMYILRITDFKRPFACFLIGFHASCFAVTVLLLSVWLVDWLVGGAIAARIPAFRFEIVCVVPFLVPLLVDLALTVYPDGHPHFRFDAFAPAIKAHDKARIKHLAVEAKARLRLTPERFAEQRMRQHTIKLRSGRE